MWWRTVGCMLMAFMISGCCTVQVYKGDKQPNKKTARIKNVLRVESKDVGKGCQAQVLPGLVKAVVGDELKAEQIPFIAEPGHSYVGKMRWADSEQPFRKRWYFWIEDKGSRKVVGGKKPD